MLGKIRWALMAFLVFFMTFIFIPFYFIRPFHPWIIYPMVKTFAFLSRHIANVRVIVKGEENLNIDGPVIYIANHQSFLDLVFVAQIYQKNTVTVGKKELLYLPIFGLFYWLTGNILIDRKNRIKAVESLKKAARIINEKKFPVWIMPEGTRVQTKGLGSFKKGPFRLAQEAQVPVIPIVANDLYQCIDLNKWNSGTMIIEVLPPIPSKKFQTPNLDGPIEETRLVMEKTILENSTHAVIKDV